MDPIFWAYLVMVVVCVAEITLIFVAACQITERGQGEGETLLVGIIFSFILALASIAGVGVVLTDAFKIGQTQWLDGIWISMVFLEPLTYATGYLFILFHLEISKGV